MKLIMCKGIPSSGKSTWAREYIKTHPEFKIVNKDSLRSMLDGGKWSQGNEKFIIKARDALIMTAFAHGKSVISDDTNLQGHEQRLAQLAKEHDAEFEVKFFDIDVEEAIKRDLARSASVGEQVIRKMYRKYIAPFTPLTQSPGLPRALWIDLDGTLCKMSDRSPYDWGRVGEDTLVPSVAEVIHKFSPTHVILLVSGRDAVCSPETVDWLERYNIHYDHLFMRDIGDTRKDNVVKIEIFENYIKDKFHLDFCLDDRDSVVRALREYGLTVYQVAEGAF